MDFPLKCFSPSLCVNSASNALLRVLFSLIAWHPFLLCTGYNHDCPHHPYSVFLAADAACKQDTQCVSALTAAQSILPNHARFFTTYPPLSVIRPINHEPQRLLHPPTQI